MEKFRKLAVSLAVLGMLFTVACGSDNDNETDGGASVSRLGLENSVVPVGSAQVVSVQFSFSSDDVFDDDRDVVVVVQLPATVDFRSGTAEIKRPIDDNDVGPEVIECADGSTFLRFTFNEDALFDAENPDGDADAELRLTIDAIAAGAGGALGAAAANDGLGVSCGVAFPAQRTALLDVV